MDLLLAQSGSNTGIPWAAIAKIAIVALILGGGVLERVLKRMNENAKKRKAADMQRQREHEMLRTGRNTQSLGGGGLTMGPSAGEFQMSTAPTGPGQIVASDDEAKRRLAELARRRREQIEQLARQGGSPRTSPGVPAPLQRSTGTPATRPQTAAPQRPTPPVVAVPAPTSTKSSGKPASKKDARKQRPAGEQRPRSPSGWNADTSAQNIGQPSHLDLERAEHTRQLALDELPKAPPPAPSPVLASGFATLRLGPGTRPDEVRRALILGEVLGRPLADRDSERDRRVG